ncbi:hypothetical protein ACL02T_10490 [Pseudonocardia sp. RS010]|uniref:hypothetical protein n=1 Tax=Pseudonocardia sp. RS010 TaxID=3385979 RepID=UPI0039A0BAB3
MTAAFGAWMIVGLFADGWAHFNVPGLESFFTPWHGLLYSGFAAGAGWLGVLACRHRDGRVWFRSLPAGYGLGAVGVGVFGFGGLADMGWHGLFGVEAGLDALVSPTHLVLLFGGMLLLTTPLRAGWARPWPSSVGAARLRLLIEHLPPILSLALATALAAFFLLYTSVFSRPVAAEALTTIPEGMPGHEQAELPAGAGLSAYLITTVLVVVPLLLAQRLDRRPPGSTLLVVAVVAWLSAAVAPTAYGLVSAAAVTVAAGLVDMVVVGLDRLNASAMTRLVLSAAAAPVLLWPAQLGAAAAVGDLGWPVELWSGVVVLSGLLAAALAVASSWGAQSPRLDSIRDVAPTKDTENTTGMREATAAEVV